MKNQELFNFIMNVSDGKTNHEFSPYHPLYKDLTSFPKYHALQFMQDYIDVYKCLFVPKLKFVKIIKSVSTEYNLKQKTLVLAKSFVDKCVLELKHSSIITDKKEKPSEDYYDGFY